MKINADFMNGLSRQLDTTDVVSRIQNFSGNNQSSFLFWMKHIRREALEKQPIDGHMHNFDSVDTTIFNLIRN